MHNKLQQWSGRYKYIVKKSMRKSIALKIKNGQIYVHAPFFMTDQMIHSFVLKHTAWIEKKLSTTRPSLIDPSKIDKYKADAKSYIPRRVEELAQKFGLEYKSVKITSAKTRWGSCSSNKSLNFTYRLILTPKAVIDYVIIHELAHTVYMNHSQDFRWLVKTMMSDYKNYEKYLKENADLYMN